MKKNVFSIAAIAVIIALIMTACGDAGGGSSTVTGVEVKGDTYIAKGSSKNYTADVKGSNNPSQEVTWSIETAGKNSSTRITPSGRLTVAAEESLTSLTIKATSKEDSSKSGVLTVEIRNEDDMPIITKVTITAAGTIIVVKGGSRTFTANVEGEKLSDAAKEVNWSIETPGAHSGTTINSSGLLSVAAGETLSSLTVRAVSKVDNEKFDEAFVGLYGGGGGPVTVPDPIHYWPMAGDANDIKGGKNGTLSAQGIATFVNDGEWGRNVLKVAPDGVGQYPFRVQAFGVTLPQVTAAMWIKPENLTGTKNFLAFKEFEAATAGLYSFSYDDEAIGIGNGTAAFGDFKAADYNGKWTHLALTIETGKAVLYVNGEKLGERTGDQTLTNWWGAPNPLTISITGPAITDFMIGGNENGNPSADAGQIMTGLISDVMLFDTVLAANQIGQIVNDANIPGVHVDVGGGGEFGFDDGADTSMITLTANTNRPQSNLFVQGSSGNDYITLTASGIGGFQGDLFAVVYTIKDIFGDTVKQDMEIFAKNGGATQTRQILIDKSKLGHFTFRPAINNVASIPAQGSRPEGFITYAVVVNPASRRQKAAGTSADADKYIYFGMTFAPTGGSFDSGVNIMDYLGLDATTSGAYAWRDFVSGTTTNTASVNSASRAAFSLPYYTFLDMTPYIPAQLRTPAGGDGSSSGFYGGELNAAGETALVDYVKALAQVHIQAAPNRPYHYYQILWEPVDWWSGWAPSGDAGDTSIVRVYELAYNAIHAEYNNEGMNTKPVVLGPTKSETSNPRSYDWHVRLFNKGLIDYIDGLSIHPYDPDDNGYSGGTGSSGTGADLAIADSIKDLMALVRTRYAARTTTKYLPEPFFWGTEQGMMESPQSSAPVRRPMAQAQVLARYNLIMLGEGFDHNQSFCFADFDVGHEGYGFFYNIEDGVGEPGNDWATYAPTKVAPKQAVSALAAASWLLKGYKTEGRLSLSGTNFGYKYKDAESSAVIYAVWNHAGASSNVTITSSGPYKVYDIAGNETGSGSGTITLTTSGFVQYVKVN